MRSRIIRKKRFNKKRKKRKLWTTTIIPVEHSCCGNCNYCQSMANAGRHRYENNTIFDDNEGIRVV